MPTQEIQAIQSSICFLIKSFFETLTPDQFLLLVTGSLDETVKALMVDLISKIIQNLSTILQNHIKTMDTKVTQELVQSSLGNAVTESFKAALSVTARGQSRSAEALRDMISEEVLVSVQCSMSDTPKEHVPTPKRLEKMQKLASKMIKAIKKKVFTPCQKGDASEPSELTTPSTVPQSALAKETEDICEGIPMDFSGSTSSYFSEENPLDFSEENPLDVSEENPLDFSEENPLDVSEENPLDVSEENPLDVSEENPFHVSEENPFHVSEENPFHVSEENPFHVSEENPLDFYKESPVTSMQVTFLPTSDRDGVTSPSPSDLLVDESRKESITLIVERLVSLTYLRSNVGYYLTDPAILIERLVARTMAAVDDVYFDPSQKNIADLEKAIFKDLLKRWGCAVLVLTHMKAGSPALEKFIANAVKTRLAAPHKKKCPLFSIVGKAFCSDK